MSTQSPFSIVDSNQITNNEIDSVTIGTSDTNTTRQVMVQPPLPAALPTDQMDVDNRSLQLLQSSNNTPQIVHEDINARRERERTITPPPPPPPLVEDNRYCWVCFATDEDDNLAEWVEPCNCIGTIRWVHQTCLLRWVDEKQKGNSMRRVTCPQCQTEYIIVHPMPGSLIRIMEGIDIMVKRLTPFLAAGIMVGSLYWTAVTYGAVTVLQVVGHKEGLEMMEKADPLVLLLGLPVIPIGLVLGRMVRWEDTILRLIQNRQGIARKFPLLSLILPLPEDNSSVSTVPANTPLLSDQVSGTRIFCGAIILPTFSSILGRIFFESIQNNVHRTIIGGLSFILIKGALKIYFKQNQYVRKKQRRIMDYTVENLHRFINASTVSLSNRSVRDRHNNNINGNNNRGGGGGSSSSANVQRHASTPELFI